MTQVTDPLELNAKESVSRSRPQLSWTDHLAASPNVFLAIFTVVYTIGMACMNLRRSLWIDELIMSDLSDLPSIRDIWPLIGKGIELNPPLPFWITWVVHHTLGKGEILTRLPACIGFWVMCICLYHF